MKKSLLSMTCFLASILAVHAQTLYGTTFDGGVNGGGTINRFVPGTGDFAISKSFESFAAQPLYTNLIQASNGKLYGTTTYGGSMGYGLIFSFDPTTSAYTKLKDFDNSNGGYPFGGLIQASDGQLYGMTSSGGSGNYGVIFAFNPTTSAYTKLVDFDNASGADPYSNTLMQAGDGKLYGMTIQGGNNNDGVIFSFDPATSAYKKLMDFDGTNGSSPYGSLIQASDGKLYGTTAAGGSTGVGVIFSFDPTVIAYTKLIDFDDANGRIPQGGSLIQASDGKLYSMTTYGGNFGYGVIFSFDVTTSDYTKLMDFDSTNGAHPYGSFIQASDGKLYSMTYDGGSNNDGVIFSFDPSTSKYTKRKDFDKTNGGNPYGNSLLQGSDGKLFAMTTYGGERGAGVIFSFELTSSIYTNLKDFSTNQSGTNPSPGLIQASNGKLYGMTTNGGSKDDGVIFSFDPSTSIYTTLKSFDGVNGANPYGSLIQASNGILYGMTSNGGSCDCGVIFSFDPSSSTYAKLRDFDNIGGANPYGSLTQATNGKLYGMTVHGGDTGLGVIFSFNLTTSTYTKLKDFDYIYDAETEITNGHGAYPYGNLTQAGDGKLYGMTFQGGNNSIDKGDGGIGIIFSFDPSSSTYMKLKDLDVANGNNPYGSFVQATDGKLYGTTSQGGSSLQGVIFSYDPQSSAYAKLNDFGNDGDGASDPEGNFIQAGNGKMYGMTHGGGSSGLGAIFSYDPSSFVYTKLIDYNGANGSAPYFGSAFIEETATGPVPVILLSFTGKNIGNANQLVWKVEFEQDLNYYELQRSIDGRNFKEIVQIKAAGHHSYRYNDLVNTALSSVYYYQLKSVDKDGRSTYSTVIRITTDHHGFAVVNPNPFKNKLIVNIESKTGDKALLIVTDVNGKQLCKEIKQLSPGTNVVEMDETARLSKGTYVLTIIESQQIQSIKIVKGN